MKSLLTLAFLLVSANIVLKDKDPLHKRVFNISITEIKNDVPSNKTIKDELEFKDGKVFSNFLNEKFDIGWIKYVIEKDTTYVDSITEADVRYFVVKASYRDADNQMTSLLCKIENENIEGEIKITKNEKPKKDFEFYGIEKASRIKENQKK